MIAIRPQAYILAFDFVFCELEFGVVRRRLFVQTGVTLQRKYTCAPLCTVHHSVWLSYHHLNLSAKAQ